MARPEPPQLHRRVDVSVYDNECLTQPCPALGAGSARGCPVNDEESSLEC